MEVFDDLSTKNAPSRQSPQIRRLDFMTKFPMDSLDVFG